MLAFLFLDVRIGLIRNRLFIVQRDKSCLLDLDIFSFYRSILFTTPLDFPIQIFGGVGIASLPLGLIASFIRRPKAVITRSQYIKVLLFIFLFLSSTPYSFEIIYILLVM